MEKKVQGKVTRLEKPNPETEDVVEMVLAVNGYGKDFRVHRDLISVWGYSLAKVGLELLFKEGDNVHASLNDGQRVSRAWSGPNTSVSECLANDGLKSQLKQWLARRKLQMSDLANLAIGHGILLRGRVVKLLPTRQNASCGAIKLYQSALEGHEVFFERKVVSIFGTQLLEHGDLGLLFPLDRSRNCDVRVQCEIRRLSESEIKVWADILNVSASDIPVYSATRVIVTGKHLDGGDCSTGEVVSFRSWLSSRGLDEDAFQNLVLGEHSRSSDVDRRSKEGSWSRGHGEEDTKRRRRSSPSSASEQSNLRKCPVCGVRHDLRDCERFLDMTATEREEVLVRHGHCLSCLEFGHETHDCQLQFDCCYCDIRHNTLLHGSTYQRPQRSRERSPERRPERRRSSPSSRSRDRAPRRPSSPVPSFDRHEREEDLWRRKPAGAALAQRLGPQDESVWQRLDAASATRKSSVIEIEDQRPLGGQPESDRRPEQAWQRSWSTEHASQKDRSEPTLSSRRDADLFQQWEQLDGGSARNSLTASIQDGVRKELDLTCFDRGLARTSSYSTSMTSRPSLSDQLQALMPSGVLPRPVDSVLPRPPPAPGPPSAPPPGPSSARSSVPMLQQAELLIEQIMSCKTPTEAAEMGILKDQSHLKLAVFIHKTLAISIKSYEETRNLRNPVLEEMQAMSRSRTLGYP